MEAVSKNVLDLVGRLPLPIEYEGVLNELKLG